MLTPEQILASHKANVETLFGLTNKAFEGVEKLVELNVGAARAALNDSANQAQAALSVKDAQELLALQASLFQPLAEKAAAYSRHLYEIASGTSAEFSKAFESQAADAQKQFAQLVEGAALHGRRLLGRELRRLDLFRRRCDHGSNLRGGGGRPSEGPGAVSPGRVSLGDTHRSGPERGDASTQARAHSPG